MKHITSNPGSTITSTGLQGLPVLFLFCSLLLAIAFSPSAPHPAISSLCFIIISHSGWLTTIWLMKRSKMDNHAEVPDIQCQPLPKQHNTNFSYPRTDFVHQYRKAESSVRDSRGSESSPPPMVEDHGSDLSAEDDCHYRVTGMDLWDSWHARDHEEKKAAYPALIHSPAGAQGTGFHRGSAMAQELKRTHRKHAAL
jgi:hypothetical protein